MVKAIIFDCFGVLTADTWKEFVATLPEAQRRPASDLNRAYGAARISKQEFLGSIKKLTNRQPIDIDIPNNNDLGTTKNSQLLSYIATLKRNYKIGLLSNVASGWIKERFLTSEEQALFDDFIFSHEVHMTKPDPGIFSLAAERLGVPLQTCVLVDDAEHYCAIATKLGMKSVCYRNFQQTKADLEKLLD